ncbi:hypothetical protein CPLU01_05265 [Colletotrichum plurivorum]|uniref:Secreted protein n=1 Tax=Colletotrichum plurivorum TaxID=2175906 RepID=A0A8H6KMS7_9PEZI|nr:hypothetical protein CPLU01_05265 [Colletotrichum plurivorum]
MVEVFAAGPLLVFLLRTELLRSDEGFCCANRMLVFVLLRARSASFAEMASLCASHHPAEAARSQWFGLPSRRCVLRVSMSAQHLQPRSNNGGRTEYREARFQSGYGQLRAHGNRTNTSFTESSSENTDPPEHDARDVGESHRAAFLSGPVARTAF